MPRLQYRLPVAFATMHEYLYAGVGVQHPDAHTCTTDTQLIIRYEEYILSLPTTMSMIETYRRQIIEYGGIQGHHIT